jgi:DNA-binding transcriptional ArsR family regulator
MAKEPLVGWMHEPLAAVLGTRGKIAVLRILWRASNPLAYREVVRRSGMAYRSIDLALGELAVTGMVEQLEGGRERRVRLRTGHRLAAAISSLLQVDADFFASLRVELRAIAAASQRDGLLAAAIVGAAARREETLGSDLEIVLIVRDPGAVSRCQERFAAGVDRVNARFGVTVKVITYDVATARAMWRTRTPAATRNVRESELLAGMTLEELLSS